MSKPIRPYVLIAGVAFALVACANKPAPRSSKDAPAASSPKLDCAAYAKRQVACKSAPDVQTAEAECTMLDACVQTAMSDNARRAFAKCQSDAPCNTDCMSAVARDVQASEAQQRLKSKCTARAKECSALPCDRLGGSEMSIFKDSLLEAHAACFNEKDCAKATACITAADTKAAQAVLSCATPSQMDASMTSPSMEPPLQEGASLSGQDIDKHARFGDYTLGLDRAELHGLGRPRGGKGGETFKPAKGASFAGQEWKTTLVFKANKLETVRLDSKGRACPRAMNELTTVLGAPQSFEAHSGAVIDGTERASAKVQWRGAKSTVLYDGAKNVCSITLRAMTEEDNRPQL